MSRAPGRSAGSPAALARSAAPSPAAGLPEAAALSPGAAPPALWLRQAVPVWTAASLPGCRRFHQAFPGYAPTPLRSAPGLAAELGAGAVFVKDESGRLGLPAFKILGASWAVFRALYARIGADPPPAATLASLERQSGRLAHLRLLAASDGNHGRAVARMASLLGLPALILVPAAVGPHAVAAIEAEGALVRVTGASYDEAVAEVAALAAADERQVLIQDTSWPGYQQVPGWIEQGYLTLLAELDEQLAAAGHGRPDLVVVPAGVGSLLGATIRHYRAAAAPGRVALLAVEPACAACVQASTRAGEPVTVPTAVTAMEGLNCGTVSAAAWPAIRDGLDAAVSVTDASALGAAARLARLGIHAGPCGAASLAGLSGALGGPAAAQARERLRVTAASTVVLLSTEGPRPAGAC
ncbi:MAG TPA: diaminopropionate ammonia-lyase [Streptosporangiaceae bacterium]|jgi:diaminopropionate ammonia-lyase